MTTKESYITLQPERVINAIELLSRRIEERFPGSELGSLALRIVEVTKDASDTIEKISRPIIWVRVINLFLLAIVIFGVLATFVTFSVPEDGLHFFEFIQVLEAGINDVVLLGAGIFFLATMETRLKRRRALAALHELRSIAHTVDMIQLTKDPSRIIYPGNSTASSPDESLSPFLLTRYLDYCSEILSIVGKIAALYVEKFDDPVAMGAVNEVEMMTTGLSRKIWQKLMILHSTKEVEKGTTIVTAGS